MALYFLVRSVPAAVFDFSCCAHSLTKRSKEAQQLIYHTCTRSWLPTRLHHTIDQSILMQASVENEFWASSWVTRQLWI